MPCGPTAVFLFFLSFYSGPVLGFPTDASDAHDLHPVSPLLFTVRLVQRVVHYRCS
ncbi:hypothetical protein K523DRAFT_326013 [Schizophyllum commune Tattone D]|nr:hypothetical protein K523DRAFT_326013 [Schizophyllum commune Tattone D]